jgi:hypothetical protein
MPIINETVSQEKRDEILAFLTQRRGALEQMRAPLDERMKEEIDLYNNKDDLQDTKPSYKESYKVPYLYGVTQTTKARILEAFFSRGQYIRILGEGSIFNSSSGLETKLSKFIQNELDKGGFKREAKSFIEIGLTECTAWVEPRPIVDESGRFNGVEFHTYHFNDVWFDTSAKCVEDSDILIRRRCKLYELRQDPTKWMNLEQVYTSTPPDDIRAKQRYEAANDAPMYYDVAKNNVTDEVELKYYYGKYDLGEGNFNDPEYIPNFCDIVFVLANDNILVQVQKVETKTRRKKFIFPIRPIYQANQLVGKSMIQLTKSIAGIVNELKALTLQNAKLLVNLMFKYRRDGDVLLSELFGGPGNAISFKDNKDDVDIFNVPNVIGPLLAATNSAIVDIQETTGATNYMTGGSQGGGITSTASGISQMRAETMIRTSMMAANIYDDIIDIVTFTIVLYAKYGQQYVAERNAELVPFFSQYEDLIEDSTFFDIAMSDLGERKELERNQFVNAMNIIAPLIQQIDSAQPGQFEGLKNLLRLFFERLNMENADAILNPKPTETQDPMSAIMAALGNGIGGGGQAQPNQDQTQNVNPTAPRQSVPEEEAFSQNSRIG